VSTERPEPSGGRERTVIVAARDEADRIASTLGALARAFPGARVVVADDGSRDATAAIAVRAGAELASRLPGAERPTGARRGRGKGGAVTAAARAVLAEGTTGQTTIVLCDGDLGASAKELSKLAEPVEAGDCDLAVATFARREGGGFGIALGFARWAVRDLTGVNVEAPLSGQRALRGQLLARLLPFAPRFGIETAMTVDALRAGARLAEIELDLEHRATGRTLDGFLHRARQLRDFVLVYLSRRFRGRR
jgi:glycosyltransferase involved in cell wall biosynthesis